MGPIFVAGPVDGDPCGRRPHGIPDGVVQNHRQSSDLAPDTTSRSWLLTPPRWSPPPPVAGQSCFHVANPGADLRPAPGGVVASQSPPGPDLPSLTFPHPKSPRYVRPDARPWLCSAAAGTEPRLRVYLQAIVAVEALTGLASARRHRPGATQQVRETTAQAPRRQAEAGQVWPAAPT